MLRKTKIYMEAFPTNGSNESLPENAHNPGMYVPDKYFIDIDFDKKTVNGTSYISPEIDWEIVNVHHAKPLCDIAEGEYALSKNGNTFPKFVDGLCIGWTVGENPLMIYGSNMHPTDSIWVWGLDKYVDQLRFSASGLLKYYVEKGDSEIRIIPDYDRINISFVTTGGIRWTFKNGRYLSAVKYDET
jgi:hypothetical protein